MRIYATASIILSLLAACASAPPYHTGASLSDDEITACLSVYNETDQLLIAAKTPSGGGDPEPKDPQKISEAISSSMNTHQSCWQSSWEHHTNYDLFFSEYDDEGWSADTRDSSSRPTRRSQMDLLFKQLDNFAQAEQPLDIVIFTHGWHGSPQPESWYAVEFRSFLEQLAQLEIKESHTKSSTTSAILGGRPRRVVGIYVGWRGDSALFPNKIVSVWDRKLTAEIVSVGAVQGLFARMRRYYLSNGCHVSNSRIEGTPSKCGQVRMLTIGHSYGALIDFRSLFPDMEIGLGFDDGGRVHSFGDLVVLLNPAFEGTRYHPLFQDAMQRGNYVDASDLIKYPAGAQLPVLITLQSTGDVATGKGFPLFRHVTTTFEDPRGEQEKDQNIHAIGWIDDFVTHRLCLDSEDVKIGNIKRDSIGTCVGNAVQFRDSCDSDANPYRCRNKLWAADHYAKVGKFGEDPLFVGSGMWLVPSGNPGHASIPDYFPYWDVRVDTDIMKDHDDIWNNRVNSVILQFYWSTVAQADSAAARVRESARGSAPKN